MHADVSAVSVKREADDVTECSHDDLSTTTTGEYETYALYRMVALPMTLSAPLPPHFLHFALPFIAS